MRTSGTDSLLDTTVLVCKSYSDRDPDASDAGLSDESDIDPDAAPLNVRS